MASLHQFLFTRLGRSLNWTVPRSAMEPWRGGALEETKSKGLLRELPLGPVDCPSHTCTEGCTIRPEPAREKGPGMVRLPCFPGRASDMVVPDDDVIYLECRADKAFALLCRSNDAECLFEAAKHSEGAAILVGRIPWAEGAHLWFISTPRRIVGPAEIAPVLASSDRPALVLFPPGHAVGALDAVLLADARVHLLEMDQYLDWELLELQRLAVLAEMSRQVRSEPGEESQARLVLRVAGCEAFFLGQRLDLRPAEFGFLFAVAETPRATVPHDRIADVVAMVLNRLHSDEYREPDPGPNNKHKSNVVKAFRRLISDDLIPKDSIDPANLIIANKGVGFRLEEGPVLIRK